MGKSWQVLEDHVRQLASLIWHRDAKPEQIAGVNVDCVLKVSADRYILIEITERRDLDKVREDVNKLDTARGQLFHTDAIASKCICVVGAPNITTGMVDAGKERKIDVMSLTRFERMFFDYTTYYNIRSKRQFGSSFNSLTGTIDDRQYTPVSYLYKGTSKELRINDICDLLRAGKHVVMTGEYGSGKSRCVREIFKYLGDRADEDCFYPIGIDLRENWGLKRATEIVRRHFDDLGLEDHGAALIRGLSSNQFIFLLDGFDELGSQSWSNDAETTKNLRFQSLAGIRDLVSRTSGGVFICGREHYFNTDEEMLSSLGLKLGDTVIIQSKTEFSEEEINQYLSSFLDDYVLPSWIPRRPLICQVIAALPPEATEEMFGSEGGDVEFWKMFMKVLCDRDANINPTFDSGALYGVLGQLARTTRTKAGNVGPITLGEVQKSFESVVGELPIEQASVMLQRLPGLGRIKAESNDRQFIDTYILDGLRAIDVINLVNKNDTSMEGVIWRNPLEQLGQRLLAKEIQRSNAVKRYLHAANRSVSNLNRIFACDIVAAICETGLDEFDFGGLAIDEGHFVLLDLSHTSPKNLRITNSSFITLILPPKIPSGTFVSSSICESVYGVSSAKGLPSWLQIHVDKFVPVSNVASIRKMGLSPAEEILVTIIRKTFFQKGSGRKEEALLRGLGKIATAKVANKIINKLVGDDILRTARGDEGTIYIANRAHADRMRKLLDQLNLSQDEIWLFTQNL